MDTKVPYTNYESRPRILDFGSADPDKIEKYPDGNFVFRPAKNHGFDFSELVIHQASIYDLLPATYEGLLEDLVPGSDLADKFLSEWSWFDPTAHPFDDLSRDTLVYFPRPRHFVRFSSPFWHRLTLVMRNSTLQRDPLMRFGWGELRARLESAVVAVAGCSIGLMAAHATVRDLRPRHIKVADWKAFHLTNANRVMLGYEDFGRNKAVVSAEQIHRTDPFMKISVYDEGIHEGNIGDFLAGNASRQEPPTTVLIEEMDDVEMKIRLREAARVLRIPVIMMTDIGSIAQLDVRRFDSSAETTLFCGLADRELYSYRDKFMRERTHQAWYQFFMAVVGNAAVSAEEFRRIILKEDPPLFGGAPQLGSTVMTASGIAAEAVARIVLGYSLPERMFFNKHTGEVGREGVRK